MRHTSVMCSLATLIMTIKALGAGTIHVPADYAAIQDAMNAAVDGDTVLVAPGTYREHLNFLGKAITVTTEQGPDVTIIDGDQAGSVVTFASGEGLASVLSGFTLQNGRGGVEGGGSSLRVHLRRLLGTWSRITGPVQALASPLALVRRSSRRTSSRAMRKWAAVAVPEAGRFLSAGILRHRSSAI